MMEKRGFKQFHRTAQTPFKRIFEARNQASLPFFVTANLFIAAIDRAGFLLSGKKFDSQTVQYRLQ